MEFVKKKRNKRWKKKKRLWQKRLRERIRVEVEVKSSKYRKVSSDPPNKFGRRSLTMDLTLTDSFWKNYTVAQDWQRRHSVTWWKSRCLALEHENEILRNQMKILSRQQKYFNNVQSKNSNNFGKDIINDDIQETMTQSSDDEVEFNMTEEMLKFLEKSERHKREMKKEKSRKVIDNETHSEDTTIIGGAAETQARREEADALYGDVSSKILAMEAALQVTMDSYKDKQKPQYWPNIPLKP